jgi:hypothetical protein
MWLLRPEAIQPRFPVFSYPPISATIPACSCSTRSSNLPPKSRDPFSLMGLLRVSPKESGVPACAECTLSAVTSIVNAAADFSSGYPHDLQRGGLVRQVFPTLRNPPACYIDFNKVETQITTCNRTNTDTKTNSTISEGG